ncbi:MAG: P-loop NTPase [candidate division Zixibacteria bacterium]|nr:P-loop NTPase [candidate division Zixibacteria bacterium]
MTLAQKAPLSGALIVTTPQDVAIGVAHKGLKMFQQVNVPILGIIENMSGFICGHCGEVTAIFKEGGGESMATELGVPYLGSIPLDPEIMYCGEDGIPLVEKSPRSPAGKAFLAVAEKFQQQIEREYKSSSITEPIDVEMGDSGELRITWPSGHTSIHSPYNLRRNCVCASCVDENTGKRVLEDRRVPLDIKIKSYHPIGRYALKFSFSDHHSTGIYAYKYLRTLCECTECTQKRGNKKEPFSV